MCIFLDESRGNISSANKVKLLCHIILGFGERKYLWLYFFLELASFLRKGNRLFIKIWLCTTILVAYVLKCFFITHDRLNYLKTFNVGVSIKPSTILFIFFVCICVYLCNKIHYFKFTLYIMHMTLIHMTLSTDY